METIVIYPGRFHPFHRCHIASYEYLTKKYSVDNVYVATSNKQDPSTSPFSYADKVTMMTKLGVPASHIVQVKNPYQAAEIQASLTDEERATTALIYAVSEKDMAGDGARFQFGTKKNGEPSYLQPLPENPKQIQPMTKHAYVAVTPTVTFRVKGADANSASQIRELYKKGNDADRDGIIADLYGEAYPDLRDIFDDRLGVNTPQEGIVYGQERIFAGDNPVSVMRERREQLAQKITEMQEQLARFRQMKLNEQTIVDYIDERETRKK